MRAQVALLYGCWLKQSSARCPWRGDLLCFLLNCSTLRPPCVFQPLVNSFPWKPSHGTWASSFLLWETESSSKYF